jgi:hypothetical protein
LRSHHGLVDGMGTSQNDLLQGPMVSTSSRFWGRLFQSKLAE